MATPPAAAPVPPAGYASGAPAGYPGAYGAFPSRPPRVGRNLRTLGILWCVFGAYRVIMGLVGMVFLRAFATHAFGGRWPFSVDQNPFFFMPNMMGALVPLVLGLTVVSAALAFLVGFSLLTRQPWGRVLAIVAAVLALLKFPIGTALGIYTLWVLAPATSGLEYETLTQRG